MIPRFSPTQVDSTVTADITDPARQAGGVLTVSSEEFQRLGDALRPVQAAFAEASLRLATDRSLTELALELGVGSDVARVLPGRFTGHSFDVLRLDFILSEGEPVVLEANYGAAVGGSIDAEAHGRAAGGSVQGPNSARIRWAARYALAVGQSELFLPHWPWSHIKEPNLYFESSDAVARAQGVRLRIVSFEEFAQLRRRDPHPRVALRLFATLDAVRHDIDLDALGYGPGSEVHWLQDESVAIPSNKALMASAVLREVLPSSAALLPHTALIAEEAMTGFAVLDPKTVRDRRSASVLKPTFDHGGTGVVVGPGVTEEEWADALSRSRGHLSVVQEFYPTDEVAFANRYDDGSTVEFTGPVSYGAYFVQSELVGVLARVGSEHMRNSAVNGNTGAVLTALTVRHSS